MKKLILVLFFIPLFSFSQKVNIEKFNSPKFYHKSIHKTTTFQAKNELMANYDVKFYGLDLNITNLNDYISGNVSIKAQVVTQPLSTFVIELIDQLEVSKILFNENEVSFTHNNDEIKINIESAIPVNDLFTVQIFYEGESGEEGMQNEIDEDWGFPVTFTLSETWHAKEWFPCKEVLSDKADSVFVSITTNSDCKAGANGILTKTIFLPNGKVRYEWKSHLKTTYYLIFVVVADYEEYNIISVPTTLEEPVLIQNYLYDNPLCLQYYKDQIDVTAYMLELFSELYGSYPFYTEKYGHAMWPWGGAMEHQTMTTTGTFDFTYTSHELGHSWFGDYVTCATWQDIWINEGFASYSEHLALEYLAEPEYIIGHLEYAENYARNATEGSIYLSFEDAQNESEIFNYSLTYRKGLMLVHMIRYIINDDELFYDVLQNFISEYADSVARGIDFKRVLEETTSMDFTNFFNQWFFGEGYPVYHVAWIQNGNSVNLNITQQTTSENTPFFDIPIQLMFYTNGSFDVRTFIMNSNTESYNINLDFDVDSIIIDPYNWILNGDGSVVNTIEQNKFSLDKLIEVYPNPTVDESIINIHNLEGQKIEIQLINASNQEVLRDQIVCISKNEKYQLSLNNLPNGLYFIIVKNGNTSIGKKIMKL